MSTMRAMRFIVRSSVGVTIVGMVAGFALPATAASPLPYSPDTCEQGFVWREARPSDHVCVTPDRRAQATLDNSQAAQRRASPSSSGRCAVNDGKAYTGVPVGSDPTRYQAVYSPYLGARWNSCAHAVTLYIGDYSQGTHYNLLANGKQRELTGTKGPRQFTLKDSEFAPGTADFAIQGCARGGGGIFGTDVGRGPSVCTNWSPTVKLVIHLGSSN